MRALIGKLAMVYRANKLMEKSQVSKVYRLINHLGTW